MRTRYLFVGAILAGVLQATPVVAQSSVRATTPPTSASAAGRPVDEPSDAPTLDSLVALALAINPAIRAAGSRIDAARARVGPAAALADPMLMLGIINQPLGRGPGGGGDAMASPSGPDEMTMRMVGVSQTLPFPGKRPLARLGAELEVAVARASVDVVRRQVEYDVKAAWYDIAFIDQALTIVDRNRDVLAGLIKVAEARYGLGSAGQQDVLRARVEATRLAETASELIEQRHAAVALLNGVLDRPVATEVPPLAVPERLARAAVGTSADVIRFTSAALGARAADSPLRSLEELQSAAVQASPELREQEAMIAVQRAKLELARKASLPDVDLSLQYGQRSGGLPDMVSATVSFPLAVFKGRKQDQQVIESTALLHAATADRAARTNAVRAEVTRLVAEIERERTRLALTVKAILPQGRAAMMSSVSSYQTGKAEFLAVLENQATVFSYETEYFRALSDFATRVAALERVVGTEVLK
ncbi:MAG: TolC family protein [Gemmatimonadota bacterium]